MEENCKKPQIPQIKFKIYNFADGAILKKENLCSIFIIFEQENSVFYNQKEFFDVVEDAQLGQSIIIKMNFLNAYQDWKGVLKILKISLELKKIFFNENELEIFDDGKGLKISTDLKRWKQFFSENQKILEENKEENDEMKICMLLILCFLKELLPEIF